MNNPATASRSIVVVGAGSTVFTPGLLTDLASSGTFDDWTVHLVDINADAAETMARVGRRIAAALPVGEHLAVPGHHCRLLSEGRSHTHSPVADRGVPGRRVSQNSRWTSKVERAGRWPDGHRCARTLIGSSETMVDQ